MFEHHAADGGEPWRIFMHVPALPAPQGGWPLLVLTDGNAVVATAVDAMRVQSSYPAGTDVGPGVVVAVGYPIEGPYDPLRRSFDLGPPPGQAYPPFFPGSPPVVTGGADRFLTFLENTLLPFIETLTPIDPVRRTLFGHSFGGLFALHALFSATPAFSRFVAASPSIYWEDAAILQSEAAFDPPPRDTPLVIHLSAGEYEGDALAPFQLGREDSAQRLEQKAKARTIAFAQELTERLGTRPGIKARFEIFPGETHMSVVAVAVSRAVQVAFALSDPGRTTG